jgi:hypothetical protein
MRMFIARVIVGALLLVFGRRLFWFFVAASGFAAGVTAANLAGVESEGVSLIIGVALGLLGALAATLFQKFAIVLAGFLAGAFIALRFGAEFGLGSGSGFGLFVIAASVAGAVLMSIVFDAALVGLSALAGASLVVEGLQLRGSTSLPVFVVLFLVGVAVQSAWMRPKQRETRGQRVD